MYGRSDRCYDKYRDALSTAKQEAQECMDQHKDAWLKDYSVHRNQVSARFNYGEGWYSSYCADIIKQPLL